MEMSYIASPSDAMPSPTTAVMPSITYSAQMLGTSPQPGLTPSSLLNPMPSITNSTPAVVGPACTGVNQWINDNPLFALGILAGLAFIMLGGKKGHGHH